MFANSGRDGLIVVLDVDLIQGRDLAEATRRLLEITKVSPVRSFVFGEGTPPDDFERFHFDFFEHELVGDWLSLERPWDSIENTVYYPDEDDRFDESKRSVLGYSYHLLDPRVGKGTFAEDGVIDGHPEETWEESIWPGRRKAWIGIAAKSDLIVS